MHFKSAKALKCNFFYEKKGKFKGKSWKVKARFCIAVLQMQSIEWMNEWKVRKFFLCCGNGGIRKKSMHGIGERKTESWNLFNLWFFFLNFLFAFPSQMIYSLNSTLDIDWLLILLFQYTQIYRKFSINGNVNFLFSSKANCKYFSRFSLIRFCVPSEDFSLHCFHFLPLIHAEKCILRNK